MLEGIERDSFDPPIDGGHLAIDDIDPRSERHSRVVILTVAVAAETRTVLNI